jgi:hypothetical protein
LRKIIQKTLQKYENSQTEKIRKFTGTIFYTELKTNSIPGWFCIGILIGILFFFSGYIVYISKFLEYFVNLLEIPKVLKLPFLENKDIYRYPALGFYVYITIALLWDISNRLDKIWGKTFYFTETGMYLKKQRLFTTEIQKIPISSQQLSWKWQRGWIRDFFGMNQLILESGNEVISSGYFYPLKNSKFLQSFLIKK